MNSKLSKILSLVSGFIGILAIYFLTRIIMEGDDTIESSVDLQNSIVSPYISFAKIMLILTSVLAVVFSILNLIKHPKLLKKTLMAVAVLGVLLVISYAIASDAAVTDVSGNVLKNGEAGSVSKWVSTGIWYSVILGGVALFGVLMDFVKSIVKN